VGSRGKIGIIACESGRPLAEKISEHLGRRLKKAGKKQCRFQVIDSKETHFANGEVKTSLEISIRGMDIYVIQDPANSVTEYSPDTNLRALKTAINAARGSDATNVTAIVPYFPYGRQDRTIGRESRTAGMVLRELEVAGMDRLITLDVHNSAIANALDSRTGFEDLHASKNILDYLRAKFNIKDFTVVSPDPGASRRCEYYADVLETDLAMIYKRREYDDGGKISKVVLLGDVEGKDALLVDDMIDSAGTAVKACQLVKSHGAKRVLFATSLPIFSDPAIERLTTAHTEGSLDLVLGTNAIYHGGDEFREANSWYREVNIAGYIAKVIYNINHTKSISELLEEEKRK